MAGRSREPGPDACGNRTAEGPVDRAIARVAYAHDGIVTDAQLFALGLNRWSIKRRVARGWLHAQYPGVYAVGHELLTQRGRWCAALAAIGGDAVLAGFAAAEHWELMDTAGRRIDVITTNRAAKPRQGIALHRVRRLEPHEVTVHRGLAITTVARTLLDLAGLVNEKSLMDACARAAARRPYDRVAILDVLGRGRRGSAALRKVLATFDCGKGHTKRELEHAFRRLIARRRIAPPTFNARLRVGVVPDALWEQAGFVVELDSREFHDTEPAFFTDREKDLIYEELGLDCLRLTWHHVVGQEARIAAVLARRVGLSD